jgi:deoxycytidine triphosphate deaminase
MILSGQQIEQSSKSATKLIEPFDLENVRRSSYDLTIGYEFYCGNNGDNTAAVVETQSLGALATFSIPAHGVCFILCSETISLPNFITARVALRMSLIYQGLVLTAQPPFDPGYSGKVIVMLHNLSSRSVSVSQGDRLATIEFSTISSGTLVHRAHRSVVSLASQLKAPLTSSLSKIDERVKKANKKINTFVTQVLTIIALVIAIPAIAAFFSYTVLLDKITELKSSVEKLEQITAAQKREIDDLTNLSQRKPTKKNQEN